MLCANYKNSCDIQDLISYNQLSLGRKHETLISLLAALVGALVIVFSFELYISF